MAAIALAILLTALVVGIAYSGAFGSQRVVQSADRISGWLVIAKQRAIRDGRPHGVRFYINTADPLNPTAIREAEYVEAPDQWVPNPRRSIDGGRAAFVYDNPGNQIIGRRAFFYGSGQVLQEFVNTPINPGDWMVLASPPGVFRINGIQPGVPIAAQGATQDNAIELQLASFPDLGAAGLPPATPPQACYITDNVSFYPGPRPLYGEPLLSVPEVGAIDSQWTFPENLRNQELEILFGPDGRVLGQPSGIICLWVRDMTKGVPANDFDNAGEQVLVTIYTRTGTISTHPVNAAGNPYEFAFSAINAGF